MLEHLYARGYRTLIHGAAPGADRMAGEIGGLIGYWVLDFPADWRQHGKAAGPIRNRQMLREGQPDLVIAFHDDLSASKGTRDMVRIARKAGIPVLVYSHSTSWTTYGGSS